MQKYLQVSSSPHLRDDMTTQRLMLDVCIALLPAGIAGVYFFGLRSLSLMIVSVLSAVFAEFLYQKINRQKTTISDLSAVVTGLLVAYNLPASAPSWVAAAGSFIAIILIKQLFGGVGQNFMNPALAARAILFISFASVMSSYPAPNAGLLTGGVDAVASATPLAKVGQASLMDLFLGNVSGVLGETSKLAILVGGAYLLIRRVIDWRIPFTFIATVFICYFIKDGADAALYQILSGGLFLGAFFMATDYASSPICPVGKLVMGVSCGILLFVIRAYASYPEGCSFAILFMNVATPLIDKLTMQRSFGEVKAHG